MDILCRKLDFGVEVFSEVYRAGQSWVRCNHHGEVCSNFEAFTEHYHDLDGNPLNTPVVEGGLEGYVDFSDCDLIYDLRDAGAKSYTNERTSKNG